MHKDDWDTKHFCCGKPKTLWGICNDLQQGGITNFPPIMVAFVKRLHEEQKHIDEQTQSNRQTPRMRDIKKERTTKRKGKLKLNQMEKLKKILKWKRRQIKLKRKGTQLLMMETEHSKSWS